MTIFRRLSVLPTAALLTCCIASPAFAQAAGQDRTTIGGAQGSQTFKIKGHFTIWAGGGLDLDVIGDVTAQSVAPVSGAQVLVEGTAYPDVYVKTQHRGYVGIGYGLWGKNEIIARYTQATNPSATVLIGQYNTASNTFPVSFSDYKDHLYEFGLRHYFATPKHTRQYMNLLGGMKTVDAISMTLQSPAGNITTPLYSKSRVPSLGLEFGVTVEFGHIGAFLESGLRYQRRLQRDDSILASYGLEGVNDTGARLFIPATIGLHLRF